MCPCSINTQYTIRVSQVMNLLESVVYTGSVTIWTAVSASEWIGLGSYQLSAISPLQENIMTCAVVWSETRQGANANFTISLLTPALMIDNS